MTRVIDGYFYALKLIIAALLAGMVVLVFGNVVLRYAFGSGITVSEEVARWFFVWLVFLGAIVGMHEGHHLGMDSVLRMVDVRTRRIIFVVSHALMAFVTVLMIMGSWTQTLINWRVTAPATGWSVGLFYGVGVVFGVSTLAIIVHKIIGALTGALSDDELIDIVESEE